MLPDFSTSSRPDSVNPLIVDEGNRFMQRVYFWMFSALVVSGGVAAYTVYDPRLYLFVYENGMFNILLLIELGIVITLSFLIHKMNAMMAMIAFFAYAVTTGLTLSVIFLLYQMNSIVTIFFVTASIFGIMSFYGYKTNRDLTTMGNIAIMWLIGIIIASLVNLFLKNSMADFVISVIGVFVFVALTAYDTQKIKAMNTIGNEGSDEDKKEAIMWALTLYLDFINLFLKLLQLFGKRK